MASAPGEKIVINVRYNAWVPKTIEIDTDWTIGTLRQHIRTELGITASEIDVIFQGKGLADNVQVKV